MLIESPSLVPIDEIRVGVAPLVVAVSEFGLPGSGNTDVIALSADGDIAIIECKLATNPESKRKVIGQILEYAAFLWGMSSQELDRRVLAKRGLPLAGLVEAAVAGEWDRTTFQIGLEQSLATGAFILVIVVDEINEELRRIIMYINECSKSGFTLHALEVRRFQSAGVEVLVPHLHGTSAKPPVNGKRKKWSEEEFFDVLKHSTGAEVVHVVEDLFEWSQGNADRVWLGSGVETGSFTFHYLRDGKTISVFTIYTNGKLMLNYGYLAPSLGADVMHEFHQRIAALQAFKKVPEDFTKWPTIPISDAFKDKNDVAAFKQVVQWLRDRMVTKA